MSTGQLPSGIAELLLQLGDALPSSRGIAAKLLAEQPTHAAAIVPALMSSMASDSSPYVRASAAYAITRLTPTDRAGVAALLHLLQDEDPHGRWTSASLLSELGTAVPEALAAMNNAVQDSNAGVRFHAAGYLSQLTPESFVAIPGLLNLLQDADPDVQEQAATAIGNLALAGYRAELIPAIPHLLALITNVDTLNRSLFMHVVSDIAPDDSRVRELLSNLLHDENEDVRQNAELLVRPKNDHSNNSSAEHD